MNRLIKPLARITRWLDKHAHVPPADTPARSLDLWGMVPFVAIHLACVAVIWVGWSWVALAVAAAAYAVRMFAITAFYHRYFSHRAFKTSRPAQLAFAFVGGTAAQRGPLWWAAHHRHHHQHSDAEDDVHSPRQHGFLWSHVGWIAAIRNHRPELSRVREFLKFPELRFLDRFDFIAPVCLAAGMFALGAWLRHAWPASGTSGWQMLVWGFCISTVVLYHCTFTINSLCHIFGTRRYETRDDSRNNFLLAMLTFGEGWHNNHHRCPGSARQGFFWWEIDLSYYLLVVMSWLGIVWDLKPVPRKVLQAAPSPPHGPATPTGPARGMA